MGLANQVQIPAGVMFTFTWMLLVKGVNPSFITPLSKWFSQRHTVLLNDCNKLFILTFILFLHLMTFVFPLANLFFKTKKNKTSSCTFSAFFPPNLSESLLSSVLGYCLKFCFWQKKNLSYTPFERMYCTMWLPHLVYQKIVLCANSLM